jgi:hypothetical protein
MEERQVTGFGGSGESNDAAREYLKGQGAGANQ